MANLIKAYQAYSPQIKFNQMAEKNEIIKYISARTGLNMSTATSALLEMRDTLLHFSSMGRSIRLEGLGVFRPTINKNGEFGMTYRPDKEMIVQMNIKNQFVGEIKNEDMIGKSKEEFIERWNTEHPNDKIKER